MKQFLANPDNPLFTRARALGLVLKQREITPSTRRAHECTEYARSRGKLLEFHHAVLERYWSHGDDIHDWAVLMGCAASAGLDPVEMKAEVEAGRWRDEMEAGLEAARQLGVSAVPTFIVGNKFVIQGAQEARVFRQAFERLQQGV